MKKIRVVAAIIKINDKVLIAQRIKGEFAGKWEFPGGKIEAGETKEEALKREIIEEMELHIHNLNYFMTAEYEYPDFYLIMDCYICALEKEEIQLHDHSAIRWLSLNDPYNAIDWIPADVQIIEKLQREEKK